MKTKFLISWTDPFWSVVVGFVLAWGACGADNSEGLVKTIATFETQNPFEEGTIVDSPSSAGKKSLRIDGLAILNRPQDWTGYDYLKADLFTDAKAPLSLYVEIRDSATTDYWTRVNYTTVVPPGKSTLTLPLQQLYVGEKSRPGRKLMLNDVVRLIFNLRDKPAASLWMESLRLERDDSAQQVHFDGLFAFDFGTTNSPVMEGFVPITPATQYNKERGFGLKNAHIWRAYDVLQPDPLYQDFLCIESGGLAVDVPNGKYRVVVNIDNPSGFWGEYQVYHRRSILAQGREVVSDTMDFSTLRQKYFRFWQTEDLPTDNAFDKYQKVYFQEKSFDIDVPNGQLNLEFLGQNWACSVSSVVIYPADKAEEGKKFLQWVENKRRFYFDNYFKRVLHRPTGDPLQPTEEDSRRGYVLFQRDIMRELYYNDTPRRGEIVKTLASETFAGQHEPIVVALLPLEDLRKVTLTASDLAGPRGTIPASAIEVGFVSYRLSRVTMEGSVYTISPRFIMPTNAVAMPQGIARQFWVTIHTPANAKAGHYFGNFMIQPEHGAPASLPVELTVHTGELDPMDIPVGPWGGTIRTPWYADDPAAADFHEQLTTASLRKLRQYGFTMFSGIPRIEYRGFKNGQPLLDFGHSDAQMQQAKELGFLAVCSYGGGLSGINPYFQDLDQMKAAGFADYSEFIRAIYAAIQKHADSQGWLPVYWNLADEPLGEDVKRSAENAAAYKKAFPKGPPFFTGASSFDGRDTNNPHFQLAKSFQVVDWNDHNEDSVNLLHAAGGQWAFYNGGSRWTFGDYLYKAAKQYDAKFRLSWHWNATAGDPYYALDCREDDYAWCNSTPDGRLVPTLHFEQLRAGIDDYRGLLTLARLVREHAGTAPAKAAEELIASRLGAFKLGQRDHDALFPPGDWQTARHKIATAIDALR